MAEMDAPKENEPKVSGAGNYAKDAAAASAASAEAASEAAAAAEAAEEAALDAEMAAMAEAVKASDAAKASAAESQASSAIEADAGIELLYDIELDATLQFGSKEMLLRDVLDLGPGDVIELDRHIAEPVDLVVGDRIVARGEVVVANGNFALRILEVAAPQMRLESIRCLF